ncbi:MAG: type II toxin-antitoxin system RelE/ParE family toxin [Crocinitomicaceae bacterium]|nr:type II toxin-antitoxin system RelE/ParE family toxin [Crocinitomicaceae bacterium]
MKYVISKKAAQDIELIWLYTYENWSLEQADRYYNLLMDEIEFISENIERGRDIGYLKEGYRTSLVKSHIIFYRKTGRNLIEVVRILQVASQKVCKAKSYSEIF